MMSASSTTSPSLAAGAFAKGSGSAYDESSVEQALLAALDPSSVSHAQANAFCQTLRGDTEAWRVCLSLAANVSRAPNARFVALQVVEELLASARYAQLPPPDKQLVRQQVFGVVRDSVANNAPIATASNFLRNKFLFILVLVMRNDYIPHPLTNAPPEWPSFFTDILSLPHTETFTHTFLQLCISLHDEIACREISYSPQTHTANILIKDQMRAQNIPSMLMQTWFQILSDALQQSDPSTAAKCLKCIGLYVSWIDAVNLVLANAGFLEALVGFLSSPSVTLRMGALNCLMGLVDKGMLVPDKLAVLDLLGATSTIPDRIKAASSGASDESSGNATTTDDGDDFEDLGCKYINLTGMELCALWTTLYENKSLNTSPEAGVLKSRILKHLQKLLPHAVRVLRSEFDDTSALAFPFLDEFLKILKSCKKDGALVNVAPTGSDVLLGTQEAKAFVDESLAGMLGVIVGKMKYDEEEEYDFEGEGGEDEALFYQMRQTLRSKMEVISLIDSDMFFAHFSSVLTSTFDALLMANQRGQRMQDCVRWSEAELALHLLFIYKGPFVYVQPDTNNATTALSEILVKMMQCNISAYPHPSIPVVFFENVVRFGLFFNHQPAFLPAVLESFVDTRGLHNPSSAVRSRVCYLFMRFVKEQKELKDKLKVFAVMLVEAIRDVLYISPPILASGVLAAAAKQEIGTSIYANQLYVFEAVGFLISLEADASKQEQLLQFVLTPLMTSMQEILDNETYKLDTPDNPAVVNYLRQLITCVGSVGKGFPDFDVSTRTVVVVSPLWASVFKQALHRIILVLQRLNGFETIRDAARFAFQRLIGCVGAEILPFFQPLITAGLFSQCSTKELANFLPSVDLLMHKFKDAFSPIMNEIFVPLLERIFYFLNQTVSGFDELNEMNDLRRSYFNLMNNMFVHRLYDVLISSTNMPHLNTILQSTLHSANDPTDPASQKLALSLLSKMIAAWGSEASHPLLVASSTTTNGSGNNTSPTLPSPGTTFINGLSHSHMLDNFNKWKSTPGLVPPLSKSDKKITGTGGKEIIPIGLGGMHPLAQFSHFIYNSIVPLLFEIPLHKGFEIQDGAAQLVVFEIANCHKTVLVVQGVEYLKVLEGVLAGKGWSGEGVGEFERALVGMTTREFQTALRKSFAR
ncbi:pre-tRNA nuclear export protein [Podochytrium sp. JEL0797]|nr:pre-tRNA nuclear export protein [Podochytrium sp. JEL0797]